MHNKNGMTYDVPIISVRYIRHFVRFIEARGISRQVVLEGSGIKVELLENPDVYLTMRQVLRVIAHMRRLLPDEKAPLELGMQLDLSAHGLLGFALLRQSDYRKLSCMITQYLRVCLPIMDMKVETAGDTLKVSLHDVWELGALRDYVAKIYIGSVYTLTSLVCRRFYVEFDFNTEIKMGEWVSLLNGAQVNFNGEHNQIVMLLSGRPDGDNDNVLAHYLATTRSREQMTPGDTTEVVVQVRQQIMSSPGRDSNLERIAERIGLTPRAVRRHLKRAGFSFQDIRNEIRRVYATRYLKGTRLPLEKIAGMLGYSDQASFTKACRTWTGKTPGEIRNGYKGGRPSAELRSDHQQSLVPWTD